MTLDVFWQIIDKVKCSDDLVIGLEIMLWNLSKQELIAFNEHFRFAHYKANTWDIWGAAYLINGGCSDDGFIDFRNGLILLGKEIYNATLENADNLIHANITHDIRNEDAGFLAMDLFEEKYGFEMPTNDEPWPEYSMGENWDFDNYDENKKRLPRLTSRYW